MKGNIEKIAVVVIILVAFGIQAGAEMTKEGNISETCAYSSTYKALPMGQERLQLNYESTGVSISDTDDGPLHNASLRCLGGFHAEMGTYNGNAFCMAVRPDGDQIFFTMKSTGKLGGGAKGKLTFVGGTGKWTGLQGEADFINIEVRPIAEGTSQGYVKSKGWYKLP